MAKYFVKSLITLLVLTIAETSFAQAPQKISYQAVIRNASNVAFINATVGMRISILQGSAIGTSVYEETQTPMTNAVGLVTIEVGNGTVVSGTFASINWSTGLYWIKTETDPLGGIAYSIFGNAQLLSVPYALYAGSSSGGWNTTGNSGTVDGTNFIGTTNNVSLNFKVNGENAGRIDRYYSLGNTFLGGSAGVSHSIATGEFNSAFGRGALYYNVNGSANTAVGVNSLYYNLGNGATAIGFEAMGGYQNGDGSVAVGFRALRGHPVPANNTGFLNTAIGVNSLIDNTAGDNNTASGYQALFTNSTGSNNTATGSNALTTNTTGSNNTAVGKGADVSVNNLTNATAIGYNAKVGASNSLVLGSTGVDAVKVGIGLTVPIATLDVLGNIKIVDGTQGAGKVLTTIDGSGLATWQTPSGNSGWSLTGNTGTTASNFIGTNDDVSLNFVANGAIAGRIDPYYSSGNTFLGGSAGMSNDYTAGGFNSAFGRGALHFNVSGSENTTIGVNSLFHNVVGNGGTAVGFEAMAYYLNPEGSVAVGYRALRGYPNPADNTGLQNTALGVTSLIDNTSGGNNTASGYQALFTNSTGSNNTAMGSNALTTNTTGSNNTAVGKGADVSVNNLTNATAIGYNAKVGASNSLVLGGTGVDAVKVGIGLTIPIATLDVLGNIKITDGTQGPGKVLTSDATGLATWEIPSGGGWSLNGNSGTIDGANFIGTTDNIPLNIKVNNQGAGRIDHLLANTFWGYQAGLSNSTGNSNTAIGRGALLNNLTGNSNTATGVFALQNNTSSLNTANGSEALRNNTTGNTNTAVGFQALLSNTTGSSNTAIGSTVLTSNTTGLGNVAIGNTTLNSNTTGLNNTAIGLGALRQNTTGQRNTAIGGDALLKNTIANFNTATGWGALTQNTTGESNVANGYLALPNNTTGFGNTANGKNALLNNTTGSNNTANGNDALKSNTTGSQNTAIGLQADVASGALTNATAIGNGAIVDASNKVRIGNSFVTVIEGQVAYSFPSDARFKYNIQPNVPGLDFINKLKPITYLFDEKKLANYTKTGQLNNNTNDFINVGYNETSKILHTGFLAQDIERICKELGYEFDGLHKPSNDKDHYSLAYSQFIMPLVKGMQEQQLQIEEQKQINKQQNEKLQLLQKQLEELKQLVDKLK